MTQSASSISGNDRDDALPWSLIGTGLAAMAALYCTRGRFNGLIILAVALIASRLTSWRLPRARSISWGVRLVILAVVLVLFRGHSTNYSPVWYLNEDDTRVAGIAVAAELVLRAWERHAPGRARQSRGLAILGTFLIFLAATHTYEREAIQWVTPVYMIFMLLALRSFAWMGQPPNAVRAVRPGLAAMRVIVLLFLAGHRVWRDESGDALRTADFIVVHADHESQAEPIGRDWILDGCEAGDRVESPADDGPHSVDRRAADRAASAGDGV